MSPLMPGEARDLHETQRAVNRLTALDLTLGPEHEAPLTGVSAPRFAQGTRVY